MALYIHTVSVSKKATFKLLIFLKCLFFWKRVTVSPKNAMQRREKKYFEVGAHNGSTVFFSRSCLLIFRGMTSYTIFWSCFFSSVIREEGESSGS